MAAALDISKGTVYRAKRRYAEEGLDGVLQDRVQANRFRKLDDKGEAHLIQPWRVAQRPMATTTGPCICWPTEWWSWGWWSRYRMRRCG